MRSLPLVLFGLLCWQNGATAQAIAPGTTSGEGSDAGAAKSALRAKGVAEAPTYAPLTASERWKQYFVSAFGPGAILRSAAAAGITQWDDSPKEWKQGPEAYGDRFGNTFAKHVLRKTMESGAAAFLHEDNRYFASTGTGVWERTKHAVGSVFVARNDAGYEHFAYSRFGAALGSSFVSRLWQPPSENTAGDAAVNFGITMGADMGWNVFKEFCPKKLRRHL